MPDFLFTARNLQRDGNFGDDADDVRYLIVPDDAAVKVPAAAHVVRQKAWLLALLPAGNQQALSPAVANRQVYNDDILIYIHGYNDAESDILGNHRKLKKKLAAAGFQGQVVSFDWPCGNQALAYLGDRHKAKRTAMQLVNGGISLLASQQSRDCTINVHVLAHSTGAFVVREAFSDAEDTNRLATPAWMVSQLCFISGDVSGSCMGADNPVGAAIYRHCVRFTNYYNPYDAALALSNVKRVGFSNRVGRIGLPSIVPAQAVDVNCGPHYHDICKPADPPFYSHSWYFDDDLFMYDLRHTLGGLTDRAYMDCRAPVNGLLCLVPLPSA